MKIRLLLASAILMWTASELYAAALVTSLKGPVLVNQGAGFMRLAGNAQLGATDRVMANPGGEAILTYSDGCIRHVVPGSVVTVGTAAQCRLAEGRAADLSPPPPEPAEFIDPAVLGAAAVGAVGLAVIPFAVGHHNTTSSFVPRPISP